MPLPPLLEQKLRTARPEYPRLNDDEFCQLRAYLTRPDRVPANSMSTVQRCKNQGLPIPNADPHGVGEFLTYLIRVSEYNLRIRLVGSDLGEEERDLDPSGGAKLRIPSWSDLGVGWDGQQSYAFVPVPALGERISKADGKPLSLAGRRWRVVLQLACSTPDGRILGRKELERKLAEVASPPRRGTASARDAAGEGLSVRSRNKAYTDFLAELRSSLRVKIQGPETGYLLNLNTHVDLGFVVRPLGENERGQTTFGITPFQ